MSDAHRAAVEAIRVSKVFGSGDQAVHALDAVSVTIREGEFFTLLGPSGCGKTTLLRLIAGFELPTDGSVCIGGQEIGDLPPHRRPVNTVFQSYALFPHMSVAENVGFGLEMLGRPKQEIAQRVEEMLALVRLSQMAARRPSQLSGGQQQRVALARALATRPKVLLLDEPLSALDLKLRKEMQTELKRIQAETGLTFVFVTHDQEEALTMSDRVAVMSAGHILQVGTPRDIYEHPTSRFVADFIGETNLVPGEVQGLENGYATVALPSGTVRQAHVPAGLTPSGRVTLAVRPERVALTPASEIDTAPLRGRIENIVYFGTDTTYHVRVDRVDEPFVIRRQNRDGALDDLAVGTPVGIAVPDAAFQVLRD